MLESSELRGEIGRLKLFTFIVLHFTSTLFVSDCCSAVAIGIPLRQMSLLFFTFDAVDSFVGGTTYLSMVRGLSGVELLENVVNDLSISPSC